MGRGRAASSQARVNLVVRPAAAADIEAAYRWYERQRAGLGNELLASIRTALDAIEANPRAHPVIHRATRRVLVRRFPYGVSYRLVAEKVVVVACMHARRSPRRWKRRA